MSETDANPKICPKCGKFALRSQYGGERGEAGPFDYCDECGWDEEDEAKARAKAPPIDMAEKITSLIERVAQRIEDEIGGLAAIHAAGGPYEHSLAIAYERKLRAAAAGAIETIVTDPGLRPTTEE